MMGSRVTSRPSQIRMFLRAGSAEELVRLQLQTNLQVKGKANFTDFHTINGQFYCWFLVDVDQHPEFLEQLNGNTEDTVRPGTS